MIVFYESTVGGFIAFILCRFVVEIGAMSKEIIERPLPMHVYEEFKNAVFCIMVDYNVNIIIKQLPNCYRDPDMSTSDDEWNKCKQFKKLYLWNFKILFYND